MTQIRKNRPGNPGAALSTTTIAALQSNAPGAAEVELMRGIAGNIDLGIWQDLMNGTFRLATRCDTCGRWLTAHKSKANGRGPSCAARAVK
ncbi:DUF6011 domain-containing protein [Mycolicibacterium sp.]|uniref:DUF6011 domain-containing protein n=1 Tax=Mycolicibacterium sp. TaxID=2320850 RepID=UPI0025DDE038|nr:DUF6011 domain-containing protein [Mycolicibacterium sp.]